MAKSDAAPSLEPYQVDALAEFVNGPRKLDAAARLRSPYANLIRRGLLDKAGGHGDPTYALTEAGRATIRAHQSHAALLRERLDRIERNLGTLALDGMPVEVEVAILTAWWDSRADVPDDDPLRVAMLKEREEYARSFDA